MWVLNFSLEKFFCGNMKRLYVSNVISAHDLAAGPSKFARASHTMEMSRYKRAFEDAREEVATKLNLPTTDLEVRSIARKIVRHEYYEPDVRSFQKENSGALEYETERQFAFIDGKATYLNSDGTASKYTFTSFHERTLNDKDEKVRNTYSEESHKLELLLEAALLNAKNPVEITKYAHDAEGIRDLYTFIYDPKTNRGKIKVNNIAPDGKFFTPEEMPEKMHSLFPDRHEINVGENIFVLSNGSVESTERIISSYKHSVGEVIGRGGGIVEEVGQVVQDTAINTVQEIRITGEAIREYMKKRFQNKPMDSEIISSDHIERPSPQRNVLEEVFTNEEFITALSQMPEPEENIQLQEEDAVLLWLTRAEEILHIDSENALKLLEKIEDVLSPIKDAKEVVDLMGEPEVSDVIIPAAMLALQILAAPQEFVISEAKEESKPQVDMHENVQDALKIFFSTESDEFISEESKKALDILQSQQIDITVLTWVKELVEKTDQLTTKEVVELIDHETEVTILLISELWETLVTLSQSKSFESQDFLENSPISVSEKNERDVQSHVEHFSFAFSLWLLLKLQSYYQSLGVIKRAIDEINPLVSHEKRPTNPFGNSIEEMPEGLVQQETTPWVLLAIIWQLAMIREQGMATKHVPPTKPKKKKHPIKVSPASSGVIFTFSS
jgi:hypothetical protein